MDYKRFSEGYGGMGGMANDSFGVVFIIFMIVFMILGIVNIVAYWKLYNKAGQPGWAIIVPVYSLIIMLKIAQKPLWWIILCLIPPIGIVMAIIIFIGFIKSYGKQGGSSIALAIIFPLLYIPIIAFSKKTEFVGSSAVAE